MRDTFYNIKDKLNIIEKNIQVEIRLSKYLGYQNS